MIVSLTNRNQITIPRDIVRNLGYKAGQQFTLSIKNNTFVLTPILCSNDNSIDNKQSDKSTQISNKFTRKIESNLEEGQKFKVKYYSPCKLVIRTKNSYLKQFCKDCQGYLAEQHNTNCPYISDTVTQTEKQKELPSNKKDNCIDTSLQEIVQQKGKQTVEIVKDTKLKKCIHCGEVDYVMYKINNSKFVCKNCFKKDFKQFYIKYLKLKEQGGLN